jgi:hypothetical protein
MGESPEQHGGHVDHREDAQGAEPEESAVTEMEARASAGFEPDAGGIGSGAGRAHTRGFLEEGLGHGARF